MFGLDFLCVLFQMFIDIFLFLFFYCKDKLIYILGGGSNFIFMEDFEGIVLVNKIKGISYYDIDSYYFLRVGVGENWYNFVILCM